jgi:hypothetical protein
LRDDPVQIAVLCDDCTGVGLTVTVTVNVLPVQVPDVGVTVYVAVSAEVVLLANVPFKLDCAEAATPPETPVAIAGMLHAYVVPDGIVPGPAGV